MLIQARFRSMLSTSDICWAPDLLPVDDALTAALAAVRPVSGTEMLPVRRSVGRVAARDVIASMPLPPFDQSAVDGYGIRNEELATATGMGFRLAGTILAGASHTACPNPGEAVRLFTGAPIPLGIDAVVMEEQVRFVGVELTFDRLAESGLNIRRRGEDVGAGSTIVETGTVVDARHVAILAGSGIFKMEVRRRIDVGVLSTGSELVPAGRPLALNHIYDSNGPMLAALLEAPAICVTSLGRCRDDRGRLARRLTQISRSYDLLICSGGVSGSDADHVLASVLDAGGACTKLSIALKPGKPLALGSIGKMAIVALPGNPFASLVGALLFARPMLQTLAGCYRGPHQPIAALTTEKLAHRPGRVEFVPVRVAAINDRGVPLLEELGAAGSARISPLIVADGLASIPAEQGELPSLAPIDYYPFSSAFTL
jgi:molybdopterin molybdotransferase